MANISVFSSISLEEKMTLECLSLGLFKFAESKIDVAWIGQQANSGLTKPVEQILRWKCLILEPCSSGAGSSSDGGKGDVMTGQMKWMECSKSHFSLFGRLRVKRVRCAVLSNESRHLESGRRETARYRRMGKYKIYKAFHLFAVFCLQRKRPWEWLRLKFRCIPGKKWCWSSMTRSTSLQNIRKAAITLPDSAFVDRIPGSICPNSITLQVVLLILTRLRHSWVVG